MKMAVPRCVSAIHGLLVEILRRISYGKCCMETVLRPNVAFDGVVIQRGFEKASRIRRTEGFSPRVWTGASEARRCV